MKLFISALIILSSTTYCSKSIAEEDLNDHQWATSIGTGGVFLRKHFDNSQSIYFGARYSLSKFGGPSINSRTNSSHGVVIGYRYYIDNLTIYNYLDSSLIHNYFANHSYRLQFMYGLEKFISKEFSIEGSAGISLRYADYDGDDYLISVSIPTIGIAINYYF